MRRSLHGLTALLLSLTLLPSCATYGHGGYGHHASHAHGGGGGAAIAAIRLFAAIVEIAAVAARDETSEAREEAFAATPVYVSPPPVAPPSAPRVLAPRPARVPPASASRAETSTGRFDAPAARAAVAAQDLRTCRARGVATGWGHANVTFAPGGNVERVDIDAPAGLSADAVACLGEKLGAAVAPPFAGAAFTVGTTWFIPTDTW
jgi:hypothetical protein